jgi:hypothetical protein
VLLSALLYSALPAIANVQSIYFPILSESLSPGFLTSELSFLSCLCEKISRFNLLIVFRLCFLILLSFYCRSHFQKDDIFSFDAILI